MTAFAHCGNSRLHPARCRSPPDFYSATVTAIETAKSPDHFMKSLATSLAKCDLGAFDVPRPGAPAQEGQAWLKQGREA